MLVSRDVVTIRVVLDFVMSTRITTTVHAMHLVTGGGIAVQTHRHFVSVS